MLAQEERPSKFSEVVGEDENSRILLNIAKDPANTPNTIILSGSYGGGKTSSARLFYKALCCDRLRSGQSKDICGMCASCLRNNSPIGEWKFYHEYDSSTVNRKGAIRGIIESFSYGTGGKWSVVVLDECHQLTRDVQTLLLKDFEEGHPFHKFILCTTDPDNLLPTIRSRAIELHYTTKSVVLIEKTLRKCADKRNLDVPDEVCRILAQRSRGSMRNAYMLMDRFLLSGRDVFMQDTERFYRGIFAFLRILLHRNLSPDSAVIKTEYIEQIFESLLSLPIAVFVEEYKRVFGELLRVSLFPDSQDVSDAVRRFVNDKPLRSRNINWNGVVRYCMQAWVLDGFTDDLGVQTMLLSLLSGADSFELG